MLLTFDWCVNMVSFKKTIDLDLVAALVVGFASAVLVYRAVTNSTCVILPRYSHSDHLTLLQELMGTQTFLTGLSYSNLEYQY